MILIYLSDYQFFIVVSKII